MVFFSYYGTPFCPNMITTCNYLLCVNSSLSTFPHLKDFSIKSLFIDKYINCTKIHINSEATIKKPSACEFPYLLDVLCTSYALTLCFCNLTSCPLRQLK